MLAEAGEWVCCFGQSGFEPDLLPWRLKGSHIRLDQGTDDTEHPLLRSGLCSACGPAQRSRLGNWRGQVVKCLSASFTESPGLCCRRHGFVVKRKLTQLQICGSSTLTHKLKIFW